MYHHLTFLIFLSFFFFGFLRGIFGSFFANNLSESFGQ